MNRLGEVWYKLHATVDAHSLIMTLKLNGLGSSYVHSSIISELFPYLPPAHKSREDAYQAGERPGYHLHHVLHYQCETHEFRFLWVIRYIVQNVAGMVGTLRFWNNRTYEELIHIAGSS